MAANNHQSSIAVTYARALLELATQQNVAEPIGQELRELQQVLGADAAFDAFLKDPSISVEERHRVIASVLRPQVQTLVGNFLGVLNEHGRLGIFDQITAAYALLLDKQLGKIEVEVTVAQQLSDDELDRVRQRVSEALNKTAIVTQRVDEGIIGGLVLKVEDKLIDASVRRQLAAMKEQMLAHRPR